MKPGRGLELIRMKQSKQLIHNLNDSLFAAQMAFTAIALILPETEGEYSAIITAWLQQQVALIEKGAVKIVRLKHEFHCEVEEKC